MEGYIDYFDGWIDDKAKEYKELQQMFQKADERFGQRLEADPKDVEKYFDKCLKKIDEDMKSDQDEELRKMICLTKGNILLRKGQYLGERFFSSQKCYQQACIVLEQCYTPNETDFLNLMIQLNLGKYFRNMGKHNQRSDYRRALDEFVDIKKKIDRHPTPSYWEEHIRLEAMVNIGRTQRHLYHLKKAKQTLLDLLVQILAHSGEEIVIDDKLDHYIKVMKDRYTKGNAGNGQDLDPQRKKLYEYYLIQALLQLGIVFQKSREYDMGLYICVAILEKDPQNIDAANNLAVCLRKLNKKISAGRLMASRLKGKQDEPQEEQEIKDKADLTKSPYLSKTYKVIFRELREKKNRFASLHSIKCAMDEMDEKGKGEVINSITDLLANNPDDQEVLLLEGLYWQKVGKYENSQEILKELYAQSHQLAKGTIGLKAYYNMADNLLRQNRLHEAKKYYERIIEESLKVDPEEDKVVLDVSDADKAVFAVPPTNDLLAEIALGWCLMNLGDYEGAEKCYKELLELYKDIPDRIRQENMMRIKNNLAECLLYLEADANVDSDRDSDMERLKQAQSYLAEIIGEEPNNATTNRHLGYCHILMAQKGLAKTQEEWAEALKHFKRAELYNPEDVYVHAGWVYAATRPLVESDKYKEEYGKLIENRLKYSSGVYSIKACAKLAEYIMQKEDLYNKDGRKEKNKEKDITNLKTMYRSFARIRLSQNEEGYGMFQRFKENETFRGLDAAKRGELLVGLFRLYEQIIKIKEICRFVPAAQGSGDKWLPVHYTKISTLKKLLPGGDGESGKLRLWNTVYMNDTFEGESFIAMMKHAAKKKMQNDKQPDTDGRVMEKMKKYFPFLDKTASEEDLLVPINENIYVTSFSREENGIYMWIPYGDNAKGCTITFEEDFFDIRKTKDTLTDVAAYSDKDYPLYEIQYLSEDDLNGSNEKGKEKESKITRILHIMDEIWGILDDLEARIEGKGILRTKLSAQKEIALIRGIIADCLNEVRFLIKSSEYSFEKEIRMLHYSYKPKMETENFSIPRLYVDVERDIRIKEIKLGPKISEFKTNELVSWLSKTGNVESITKSGRHYK